MIVRIASAMDIDRKVDFASIIVRLVSTIFAEKAWSPERTHLEVADKLSHLPEHSIALDPAGYSLRLGLRHIGEILYAEGGLELMEEIVGLIAALPRYADTVLPHVIIRSAWNGIGEWSA